MIQNHLISIILLVVMGAVFIYQASFLRNKRLFRFTLHEIIYMFVVPGIVAYLLHSYAVSLLDAPEAPHTILPDSFLMSWVYLATLLTYGGMCIHSVSKALFHAGLKSDKTEAGQLNAYLHLTFSHNFTFSGVIMLLLGLTLLELNHITDYVYSQLFWPVARGIAVGIGMISAMYQYTRPDWEDEYPGKRWSDLKLVFALSWIAMIIIWYAIQLTDASIRQYQLLIPSMLGFGIINGLNIFLALRFVKNKRRAKKIASQIAR